MKSNTVKISALIFGITIVSLQSLAAQGGNRADRKEPPSFSQLLKEMDKNDDGKLSAKEIKGPLKDDFEKIDTDEDGFITEEEFEKAPKPKRRERN